MTLEGNFDVAIAGGGIVGCACALACARRGMRVALVERDALGSGATAAGMGHIVAMDDSEAQFALTRYSQKLWNDLELPKDAEYVQTGTLWIAADEEEMHAAEIKQAWYADRGVPGFLLNSRQLANAEPNLVRGLAGALRVPEDAVVYPPTVALHLARQAEKLGALLLVGNSVRSMESGRMVLDNDAEIRAKILVHALGAESAALLADVPIRKRKGHLVITDRHPGFVRHQLVELGYLKSAHSSSGDSVAFNVQPRPTGQVLIGSSRQYGAEHSEVDDALVRAMIDRALLYMPAISKLSAIRVWTGFRAATPDKLPLIGPLPGDDSIWIASGHEGLGITTSLGTAELIADGLTGRQPEIDHTPYLPQRFAFDKSNSLAAQENS